MIVKEVYKRYKIPPNMQLHMLLVAKIVRTIIDNLKGVKVNSDLLIKAALLHDIGKVAVHDTKMSIKYIDNGPKSDEKYWIDVRNEMYKKYGTSDRIATHNMLKELGFNDSISDLISGVNYSKSVDILKSNDWELKIIFYSDLRVSPDGITSMEERIKEVMKRDKNHIGRKKPELFYANVELEKQIQELININLQLITDNYVKGISTEKLLNTSVS